MFIGRPPDPLAAAPMSSSNLLAPCPVGGRFAGGRRAFTLVELLAVIAIIGTLIGLLLPAVQRIRESSRRTHCGNNMRQIALGVCGYEAARKSFPPGCDLVPMEPSLPAGTQHAWSSFVLPFIEEGHIASRIDYKKAWDAPGGNDVASDQYVPVYICPSSIIASVGKADYAGISGAWIVSEHAPFFGPAGFTNGMLFAVDEDHHPTRASSVSDGLGHTLLAGEAVDRGDEYAPANAPNAPGRWARINCFAQSEPFINMKNSDIRSTHPGGSQVAFADSRTSFLDEHMDPEVLSAICTRNGGEAIASQSGGQ